MKGFLWEMPETEEHAGVGASGADREVQALMRLIAHQRQVLWSRWQSRKTTICGPGCRASAPH